MTKLGKDLIKAADEALEYHSSPDDEIRKQAEAIADEHVMASKTDAGFTKSVFAMGYMRCHRDLAPELKEKTAALEEYTTWGAFECKACGSLNHIPEIKEPARTVLDKYKESGK